MASCTEISLPDEKLSSDSLWNQQISSGVPKQIHARDCINGTLMPKAKFSSQDFTNYTEVNRVFQEHGLNFKLDDDIKKIPHDTEITIYPKTKVNFLFKCAKCPLVSIINLSYVGNTLQHFKNFAIDCILEKPLYLPHELCLTLENSYFR